MPRIISIANEKGGVGKTTTALNISASLANMGKRVLTIDLDPQGSLSSIVRRSTESPDLGVELVFDEDNQMLPRAVIHVAERMWLLPASDALKRLSVGPPVDPKRLSNTLRRYRLPVDYVIFDTPPSIGWLTQSALMASSDLLIPVQCQFMAMRGVKGIMNAVRQVHQDGNPKLALLGVLATMYKADSQVSRQILHELRTVFGERLFEMTVADDEAVSTAPVVGRGVVDHQPWSDAAATYRWLAEEISNGRR